MQREEDPIYDIIEEFFLDYRKKNEDNDTNYEDIIEKFLVNSGIHMKKIARGEI